MLSRLNNSFPIKYKLDGRESNSIWSKILSNCNYLVWRRQSKNAMFY